MNELKTVYFIGCGVLGPDIKYIAERLNAKVIIQEDADVANALGAITSHIMIKQKLLIKPDPTGYYVVEGVKGARQFKNITKAEKWAVEHLKCNVQRLGELASTSRKTVEMEINDRIVNAGNDTSLFLDRTILATLSGSPDLLLKSQKK